MQADIVKFIVKDSTDRKIQVFAGQPRDEIRMTYIIKTLMDKYGMKIDLEELKKPTPDGFMDFENELLDIK